LLIAGYSVMDTLIHQVLSRNATVGDSKRLSFSILKKLHVHIKRFIICDTFLKRMSVGWINSFCSDLIEFKKDVAVPILMKRNDYLTKEKMEQCQIEIHFHQPLDVIVLTPFTERRHQLKRMIK
ncbi:hypothetical protein Tsp_12210, partial [Trichinella spiralis]|uniref:hypothetical protein n=1 Tax=Trichinella spiralis TaxID=6334 RepID=UPI0001EFE91C